MRLIDADKLYPDCMTKDGKLAISQSQLANAPAISIDLGTDNGDRTVYARPQGEWEDYSVDFYKCPECGYLLEKDCPCCQTKVILPKGGAKND